MCLRLCLCVLVYALGMTGDVEKNGKRRRGSMCLSLPTGPEPHCLQRYRCFFKRAHTYTHTKLTLNALFTELFFIGQADNNNNNNQKLEYEGPKVGTIIDMTVAALACIAVWWWCLVESGQRKAKSLRSVWCRSPLFTPTAKREL